MKICQIFNKDILVVAETLSGLNEKHADMLTSFSNTVINIEQYLDVRFRQCFYKTVNITDISP